MKGYPEGMRKTAAFLALWTALLPTGGYAQTRLGAIGESGLSATVAPVPTLTSPASALSASMVPAASLTPSLLAPSPIATPQPVAAKPEAAVAALVPQALTALRPAASKPEKPGSDQARASGNALFDGVAKRPAPSTGDDSFVNGSQSDRARASGLSPPTHEELASSYRRAQPKSKAVEVFGKDFVVAASELVQQYTFMGEHLLQQMKPQGMLDLRGKAYYKAAEDFIATHEARESGEARRFMQLLGAWSAHKDHAKEKLMAFKMHMMKAAGRGGPAPHLPPSPIEGGEYWDMAAGMNAQGFIHRELEPKTNYSFFDYSPFVVSYLKTAADLAGAKNATIVEGDIGKLRKPAKPVAMLRTKNAVHYVPGFAQKLEEMADWIAPGGQLAIQNDPNPGQRAMIVKDHGPLIRRLLSEGWAIEYGFSGYGGKWGRYALDTLILTRPAAPEPRSALEAGAVWKAYAAAVGRTDADFNPFAALFR